MSSFDKFIHETAICPKCGGYSTSNRASPAFGMGTPPAEKIYKARFICGEDECGYIRIRDLIQKPNGDWQDVTDTE